MLSSNFFSSSLWDRSDRTLRHSGFDGIDLLWYESSTEPMLTFERLDTKLRYCQTDQRFRSECLDILVIPLIIILSKQWLFIR